MAVSMVIDVSRWTHAMTGQRLSVPSLDIRDTGDGIQHRSGPSKCKCTPPVALQRTGPSLFNDILIDNTIDPTPRVGHLARPVRPSFYLKV